MNTVCFRVLYLLILSLFFFSSCKASRNVSSSPPTAASASLSGKVAFPASEYYGERWNNDYVRLNSDPKPSGRVTLNLTPAGSTGFVMPVCGNILSEFGMRGGRMHEGIDVKLAHEQPVYSAFDGMVRVAKDHASYGKYVVIRHDNGLETVYSHLNSIAVKLNQRVNAGTRIGGGGKTGNATSEHLHLEIRFMGEPMNPRLIIDFEKCNLKSRTITINN